MTTEPCGEDRDKVNLFLNLGIASIGTLFGLLGKSGQLLLSTATSFLYGLGVSSVFNEICE